jgi:mono/diheme cytochrome c family protein
MRRRNRGRAAALALLALAAGGCDWYYNEVPSPDDLWHVIPWFDHMITARYIRPYETAAVPRNTPPGTVPITGSEGDWSAEWMAGNTRTADALRNPFAAGAADSVQLPGIEVARIPGTLEAKGDSLYQTFCAMCHGPAGAGDGLVGRRMGAPPIVTPRARAYSDGYLYSIIRYGRGVMPRYGDKIYAPEDRWAVVNHVRRLQAGAAPAPQAAPPEAAPAAGGSSR